MPSSRKKLSWSDQSSGDTSNLAASTNSFGTSENATFGPKPGSSRRERLAAAFDLPDRRAALGQIDLLTVRHHPGSRATAVLLAGWLCSRLGWRPGRLGPINGHELRGDAHRAQADVEIALEPIDQEAPGLGGVTVGCDGGFALSLDRATGGLCARERLRDGSERVWQVLGASRGEGGILGEGVRQALLRDPTYAPALDAAGGFCG